MLDLIADNGKWERGGESVSKASVNRPRPHTHTVFVVPAGIEPASSESESEILSIVLRNHDVNQESPAENSLKNLTVTTIQE